MRHDNAYNVLPKEETIKSSIYGRYVFFLSYKVSFYRFLIFLISFFENYFTRFTFPSPIPNNNNNYIIHYIILIMGNRISHRRNHTELYNGNYLIRVDDLQIDRIQVMHHILKICCNGNFLAPISEDLLNGIHVLDVGWVIGLTVILLRKEEKLFNFLCKW